jgi:hypothetical protein
MTKSQATNSNQPYKLDGSMGGLINLLASLAANLRKQAFVFVLCMAILVVLSLWISQTLSSLIPFYIAVGALIFLTLIAFGAELLAKRAKNSQRGNGKPKTTHAQSSKRKDKKTMDEEEFDILRDWLDKLVDAEFRDLMNSLLKTAEITRLPKPLEFIDRGGFLGQMKIYGRLGELKSYLKNKYPERFNA